MRLNPWFQVALLTGAAVSMTACSTIASIFPDKQKNYRYTNELPDLEVPPDLVAPGAESNTASGKFSRPATDKLATDDSRPAAEAGGKTVKRRKTTKHTGSTVTMAESSDESALIEMSEPFDETWNDVSRALGRLKLEITDQNRSDGIFYVYYGGAKPKKQGEGSFWEDVSSVFAADKETAKEYRVKLEDKGEFTNIRVLDTSDKPQSQGPGLDLLKRLHQKLMTLDQPEAEGDEAKPHPESDKP